jgi:hypothetical protein
VFSIDVQPQLPAQPKHEELKLYTVEEIVGKKGEIIQNKCTLILISFLFSHLLLKTESAKRPIVVNDDDDEVLAPKLTAPRVKKSTAPMVNLLDDEVPLKKSAPVATKATAKKRSLEDDDIVSQPIDNGKKPRKETQAEMEPKPKVSIGMLSIDVQ